MLESPGGGQPAAPSPTPWLRRLMTELRALLAAIARNAVARYVVAHWPDWVQHAH